LLPPSENCFRKMWLWLLFCVYLLASGNPAEHSAQLRMWYHLPGIVFGSKWWYDFSFQHCLVVCNECISFVLVEFCASGPWSVTVGSWQFPCCHYWSVWPRPAHCCAPIFIDAQSVNIVCSQTVLVCKKLSHRMQVMWDITETSLLLWFLCAVCVGLIFQVEITRWHFHPHNSQCVMFCCNVWNIMQLMTFGLAHVDYWWFCRYMWQWLIY